MISKPSILVMDEVSAGLDPISRRKIIQFIRSQISSMSVLVITLRVEEVEEYCDRCAFIADGAIMELGTVQELLLKYQNKYLLKIWAP